MSNFISRLFRPKQTGTISPTLKGVSRNRQWRDIVHDITTIAAIVFFATTTQCWYVMNFGTEEEVHNHVTPVQATTEPVVESTLSCDTLKDIYDKAYIAQLTKVDDIDFLAIDKSFYETYGECL